MRPSLHRASSRLSQQTSLYWNMGPLYYMNFLSNLINDEMLSGSHNSIQPQFLYLIVEINNSTRLSKWTILTFKACFTNSSMWSIVVDGSPLDCGIFCINIHSSPFGYLGMHVISKERNHLWSFLEFIDIYILISWESPGWTKISLTNACFALQALTLKFNEEPGFCSSNGVINNDIVNTSYEEPNTCLVSQEIVPKCYCSH